MRAATAADAAGIADCWRRNYRAQGGVEGLPAALLAARTPESFRARAAARANGDAVVAVAAGGGVVGFCVAAPAGGEIEQLFVDAGERGAGTAAKMRSEGRALCVLLLLLLLLLLLRPSPQWTHPALQGTRRSRPCTRRAA